MTQSKQIRKKGPTKNTISREKRKIEDKYGKIPVDGRGFVSKDYMRRVDEERPSRARNLDHARASQVVYPHNLTPEQYCGYLSEYFRADIHGLDCPPDTECNVTFIKNRGASKPRSGAKPVTRGKPVKNTKQVKSREPVRSPEPEEDSSVFDGFGWHDMGYASASEMGFANRKSGTNTSGLKWIAFEYNTRERKPGKVEVCDSKADAIDAANRMRKSHRKGSLQSEVCIQRITKANPRTFTIEKWLDGSYSNVTESVPVIESCNSKSGCRNCGKCVRR